MANARTAAAFAGLVALSLGCEPFFECPAVEPAQLEGLPRAISESGLFESGIGSALGNGVRRYRPRFQLWTDGASKRRWIRLPQGTQIDSSDMDSWQFPVGTRLWKEFSRDAVRVETRLIERTTAGWLAASYLWLGDESDALLVPDGTIDALGTRHDVPAAGECIACHGGRSSYVLGVSAIQLSGQVPDGYLGLEALANEGLLTDSPAGAYVVPGTDTERAALGYMHANCGHCHNGSRPGGDESPCYGPGNRLDFWLTTSALSAPEDTPAYKTAIGYQVKPGRPDESVLIDRVDRRTYIYKMPPLGTEDVDRQAVELLRRWVEELE